jgi:CTP-dependent riboflavin kinase
MEAVAKRMLTLRESINYSQMKLSKAQQITETKARGQKIARFIEELRKQEGIITVFDDGLWHGLVDYATVYSYKDMRFIFKDGTEIQING